MPNCDYQLIIQNNALPTILNIACSNIDFSIRENAFQCLLYSTLKSDVIAYNLILLDIFKRFATLLSQNDSIQAARYMAQISGGILSFSSDFFPPFIDSNLPSYFLTTLESRCETPPESSTLYGEKAVLHFFIAIFQFQENIPCEIINKLILLFIHMLNNSRSSLLRKICAALTLLIEKYQFTTELIAQHDLIAYLFSYLKDTDQRKYWFSVIHVFLDLFSNSSREIVEILMRIVSPSTICDTILYDMSGRHCSYAVQLLMRIIELDNNVIRSILVQEIMQQFCEERDDLGFEIKKSFCMLALMIASITMDVNFIKSLFSSSVMDIVVDIMSSFKEFALLALDTIGNIFCFLENANEITPEIVAFFSGELIALLNELSISEDEDLSEKAKKLLNVIDKNMNLI